MIEEQTMKGNRKRLKRNLWKSTEKMDYRREIGSVEGKGEIESHLPNQWHD